MFWSTWHIRHQFYFFLAIGFMVTTTAALAQRPVNGNGVIVEQVRPLPTFSSISLDFSADVVIVNGETPSFVIEGDENVLPHIGTRVRGGKLIISQDKWIEPSQAVKIRIGAPFTSKIETSGYSDVLVEGVASPRLMVDAGVGDVRLNGSANRLMVRTKTGNIDARDLLAEDVDVKITSHGRVLLGESNTLSGDVSDSGTVIYEGTPDIKSDTGSLFVSAEAYQEPEEVEAVYIAFKLVNNSRKRLQLYVEGPPHRSFSYGFPMNRAGKRAENWPVGTRVYREALLGKGELLLTVTADMAGKNVDLFDEE